MRTIKNTKHAALKQTLNYQKKNTARDKKAHAHTSIRNFLCDDEEIQLEITFPFLFTIDKFLSSGSPLVTYYHNASLHSSFYYDDDDKMELPFA